MTEPVLARSKSRVASTVADPTAGDVSMRVLELATAAVAIAAAVLLAFVR